MTDEFLHRTIVYRAGGAQPAVVHRDLAYQPEVDPYLGLDMYLPAGMSRSQRCPAVLLIHGGPVSESISPRPKDWPMFAAYAALAASAGVAGVTFNHRLHSPQHLPVAAADLAAAIQFVRENSDACNIDPERIALWAFSGGGALLSDWVDERPSWLRCVVAYYPVLDLRSFLGTDSDLDRATVARFSVVSRIGTHGPPAMPWLLVRAGRDRQQINGGIDHCVGVALSRNFPVEVINHSEGRHGFDVLDDVPRSRDIIVRTISFIQAQLAVGD
jgi:acetyl esterase/lipase